MMFINMDNYFRAHDGVGKFDIVKQAGARVSELSEGSDETLPLQTARGKKITSQVLNEILSDEIVAYATTLEPGEIDRNDGTNHGEKA